MSSPVAPQTSIVTAGKPSPSSSRSDAQSLTHVVSHAVVCPRLCPLHAGVVVSQRGRLAPDLLEPTARVNGPAENAAPAAIAGGTNGSAASSAGGALNCVVTGFFEPGSQAPTTAVTVGRSIAQSVARTCWSLRVYLGFHADNHRILRVLVEQSIQSGSALAPLRLRFRDDMVAVLDAVCRAVTGRALDRYVFIALLAGLEGLSLELVATAPTPAKLARARQAMVGLFDALLRSAADLPGA